MLGKAVIAFKGGKTGEGEDENDDDDDDED